jgi:hypothetical protein
MKIENLAALQIHKLTQAQYDRAYLEGKIDENAIYLTPDDELLSNNFVTTELLSEYLKKTDLIYFNDIRDLGISTFPTTIATVIAAMPPHSQLVLDNYSINENTPISDWGLLDSTGTKQIEGTGYIVKGEVDTHTSILFIAASTQFTDHQPCTFVGSFNGSAIVWSALPTKTDLETSSADVKIYADNKFKCYGSLKDIGITSFPTTMSVVASKMPANSTIVIDTRNLVTTYNNNHTPSEQISDWDLQINGTAYINKGNNDERVTMLVLYGSATAAGTSTARGATELYIGNYAKKYDRVQWDQVATTGYVQTKTEETKELINNLPVSSSGLAFKKILRTEDNIDATTELGIYVYQTATPPAGVLPFDNAAVVIVAGNPEVVGSQRIQLAIRYGEPGFFKFRNLHGSKWGAWKPVITTDSCGAFSSLAAAGVSMLTDIDGSITGTVNGKYTTMSNLVKGMTPNTSIIIGNEYLNEKGSGNYIKDYGKWSSADKEHAFAGTACLYRGKGSKQPRFTLTVMRSSGSLENNEAFSGLYIANWDFNHSNADGTKGGLIWRKMATTAYVDSKLSGNTGSNTSSSGTTIDTSNFATKADIEKICTLPEKAGGTITVAGSINMNKKAIKALASPADATDAATKGYVDNIFTGSKIRKAENGEFITGKTESAWMATRPLDLKYNGVYQRIVGVGDPVGDNDVVNKQYLNKKLDTVSVLHNAKYFYIDSTHGKDSNSGGDKLSSYKTLEKVFDKCNRGRHDIRINIVRGGTYRLAYRVFTNTAVHLGIEVIRRYRRDSNGYLIDSNKAFLLTKDGSKTMSSDKVKDQKALEDAREPDCGYTKYYTAEWYKNNNRKNASNEYAPYYKDESEIPSVTTVKILFVTQDALALEEGYCIAYTDDKKTKTQKVKVEKVADEDLIKYSWDSLDHRDVVWYCCHANISHVTVKTYLEMRFETCSVYLNKATFELENSNDGKIKFIQCYIGSGEDGSITMPRLEMSATQANLENFVSTFKDSAKACIVAKVCSTLNINGLTLPKYTKNNERPAFGIHNSTAVIKGSLTLDENYKFKYGFDLSYSTLFISPDAYDKYYVNAWKTFYNDGVCSTIIKRDKALLLED